MGVQAWQCKPATTKDSTAEMGSVCHRAQTQGHQCGPASDTTEPQPHCPVWVPDGRTILVLSLHSSAFSLPQSHAAILDIPPPQDVLEQKVWASRPSPLHCSAALQPLVLGFQCS